jgi:hypothetical protein
MTTREMCVQLEEIAITLAASERLGDDEDSPEGVRFIHMSDTLAKRIEKRLFEITSQLWLVEE